MYFYDVDHWDLLARKFIPAHKHSRPFLLIGSAIEARIAHTDQSMYNYLFTTKTESEPRSQSVSLGFNFQVSDSGFLTTGLCQNWVCPVLCQMFSYICIGYRARASKKSSFKTGILGHLIVWIFLPEAWIQASPQSFVFTY